MGSFCARDGVTRCNGCSKCAHFVAARGGNAERRGRGDAEGAEKRFDERQGAKDAKGRAPRVGGFCGRMLGLRRTGGWCAFGTLFAHQELGTWGFAREKWG